MVASMSVILLFIFAILSGAVGAFVCIRLLPKGWARLLLGVAITAVLFLGFIAIQFALLRFFGDERAMDELRITAVYLLAACSIFWGPSFAFNYWYYGAQAEESA